MEWKIVDGEAETDKGGLRETEDLISRALVGRVVMVGELTDERVIDGGATDS